MCKFAAFASRFLPLGIALLSLTLCTARAEPPPEGKYVLVDKSTQKLRAYENGKLFLETRVSTGAKGAPPRGSYTALEKDRMHRSRLYHNAPMPFAVQLAENFFIHGFTSVPSYPASHGCVRVPLTGKNPAKLLFDWIEVGTPIEIVGYAPIKK